MTRSPRCVGSTKDMFNVVVDGNEDLRTRWTLPSSTKSNYFSNAQLSADGTTVITNSADRSVRSFVLEGRPTFWNSPTYATALYPGFALSEPSTTVFISSIRDHPIRLSSALTPGLLASYPLVNLSTEAWIAPHCLMWSADGTRFMTGSDSLICAFDASRPGEGPVTRSRTIPSRHKQIVGGGVGMRGIVSAMCEATTFNVLAAGTFTRKVSLYASGEWIAPVGVFSVAGTEADAHIRGSGITQVLWSPCGRYLYIAERKSDGALLYDIRKTGQLLGWLEGRKADTNQRLGVEVVATGAEDHEIWAGGSDGTVRVWKNAWQTGKGQKADSEWALHRDAVTSCLVHPTASVAVTCSGQRPNVTVDVPFTSENSGDEAEIVPPEESSPAKPIDNTLKAWVL